MSFNDFLLKIRNIRRIKKYKKNNSLIIGNNVDCSKLSLKIEGKNNEIIINDDVYIAEKFSIYGFCDDSKIVVGKNVSMSELEITLGQNHSCFGKIENSFINIGDFSTFETAKLVTFNSNSAIKIGENCMFARGIVMLNTDSHPIYDTITKKLLIRLKK